jgi:hypothetical protein
MTIHHWQWLGISFIGLLFLGCGPSNSRMVEVSGTVTWKGEPIPDGYILLQPGDGSITEDSGKITNGKYSVPTKPGWKKVQIHASRETGKIDPVEKRIGREPYIPEEYNARTILKIEVKPGGKNQFDFELPKKEGK